MRSLFPGYFKLTDNERREIEERATLVLDANVLLNLYRFSEDARSDFISLLNDYRERIWIPHQVAFEFLENRPKLIVDQAKVLEEFSKKLQESLSTLESPKTHPFVKPETLDKLREAIKEVSSELEEGRSHMEARLSADELLEQVSSLTDGRVGSGFTDGELLQIFKDGEERYKQKIPPGFRDDGKGSEQTLASQRRRFGDYIIWREMLGYASRNSSDIIFVTADGKEDWWAEQSGRKLGPRAELVAEFCTTTGQKIVMYTAQRFLEKHGDSTAAVIQEIGQSNQSQNRDQFYERSITTAQADTGALDQEVSKNIDAITRLKFKAAMVRGEIDKVSAAIQLLKATDPFNEDELVSARMRLKMLQSRYDDLKQSLSVIEFLSE